MNESLNRQDLPRPLGCMVLIEGLGLQTPLPAVRSSVIAGARRTRIKGEVIYEEYPLSYGVSGLFEHLKFALRYEPIDLGVLRAAFAKIETAQVGNWVRNEATGIYARKLWYLYELLTEIELDVPDVVPIGYVDLLSSRLQLTVRSVHVR